MPVAIGLSLIWPLYLLLALKDVFTEKPSLQTLDECRVEIENSIASIRNIAAQNTRGYGDPWTALLVDANMSLAAIRQNPNNVPIIVYALMNVVGALNILTQTSDKDMAGSFLNLQKTLAGNIGCVIDRIVEIQGRKVTDSENQEAEGYFNRLCWDAEQQDFIIKNN